MLTATEGYVVCSICGAEGSWLAPPVSLYNTPFLLGPAIPSNQTNRSTQQRLCTHGPSRVYLFSYVVISSKPKGASLSSNSVGCQIGLGGASAVRVRVYSVFRPLSCTSCTIAGLNLQMATISAVTTWNDR